MVVIWDIIKEFFEASGCPMDYVFFSNYELQVKALLDGTIHVAWNSPLAWLDAQRRSGGACRAIAMRDTDRDRVSHIVVPADGPVQTLARPGGQDARHRREGLAPGHADPARAAPAPRAGAGARRAGAALRRAGRQARRPCRRREAGAGSDAVGRGGRLRDARPELGPLDAPTARSTRTRYRVLATTDRFDHCVFTVRADLPEALERPWLETLYTMSYDNPDHREMMDMEGLKAWLPGRTTGFGALSEAVERQQLLRRSSRPT